MENSTRAFRGQIPRWLALSPFESPSLSLVLLRDYLDAGIRRTLNTAAVALADRPEDKLPDLAMPVLIVRGTRDVTVTQGWARKLTALAPEGRLVQVTGAAHTMCYSHPRQLAEAIAPFLTVEREVLR